MIDMPEPKTLVEIAHAAGRLIQDREWKQYQRYLSKQEHPHKGNPYTMPYSFEEFCILHRERTNLQSPEKT